MSIGRFEDLASWQAARDLMQTMYALTRRQTFTGDRGLTWQMREAVVSSMSNIAEADGRYSFEDKRCLLDVSMGSCKGLQSHLYVALDQGYVSQERSGPPAHRCLAAHAE